MCGGCVRPTLTASKYFVFQQLNTDVTLRVAAYAAENNLALHDAGWRV